MVRFLHGDFLKTKKMKPTKRAEIAKLVKPGGLLIELGVAAGNFAVQLLQSNPEIKYLGIDRWNDHHDWAEHLKARDRIEALGGTVLRSTFADALPVVPNRFADLIYIDGYAHTGQDGGKTLEEWWPKLKPGGIFSGHDYHPEYQPTMDAVDRFCGANGLKLNIIDESPYPSWWAIKPNN